MKLAALKGAGIVHLLRIAVAEELAAGQLVPVLPDLPLPSLPVHALHAFGRQAPVRVRVSIDFLTARFAGLGETPKQS